ncbi:MAG: RidA family protein [Methanomassiliicoccales archaeon]
MKRIVSSESAPKPIGPYSQAVIVDGFIFCSGQIGLDPKTNKLVNTSVSDETRQTLKNLKAILEASGSSIDRAVRTTIYLTSLEYFRDVNEVYRQFFSTDFPARTTVCVSQLPLGARVEIDLIARTNTADSDA